MQSMPGVLILFRRRCVISFVGKLIYLDHVFPNPTGIETKLFNVPYALKYFLAVDAAINHGCELVLWQGTCLNAKANLTPLFEAIARNGAVYQVNQVFNSTIN